MKFYWPLLCLICSTVFAQVDNGHVRKLRGSLIPPDFGSDLRLLEQTQKTQLLARRNILRNAKFLIMNGETELARQGLHSLLKEGPGIQAAGLHLLLAVADFQEQNFAGALAHLSLPELSHGPAYQKSCLLHTLIGLAMRQTRQLIHQWERCKLANSREVIGQDLVWMDALVTAVQPASGVLLEQKLKRYNPLNLSNDDLRKVLKLALYLDLTGPMVDQLVKLDYSVAQDEELRELIAQVYFRHGRFVEAWGMMKDLNGPNVENMKGNLRLLGNQQELAYAHFKLALQLKANSHNAAERALPLAWLLQQWQEGSKLASRLATHRKNQLQQLTTRALFATLQARWSEARSFLDFIHQKAGADTAHEVSQLSTYVALRQQDLKALARHGLRTCEGGDLLACWLMGSALIWPDLPALIAQNSELTPVEPLWRKLTSEEVKPFKDEEFIDQRDIDELDQPFIKLTN